MARGQGRGQADTGYYIAGCIVIVIVLITSGVLIGVSFSKLDANEVGLDYSANSLMIDTTQLYSPGVQFLGVGHSFIKFPTNIQVIDQVGSNNVRARTYDGLIVVIQCRLLFELVKDVNALASLYLMFPDGYTGPYIEITRSVVRDVASQYTASEFWGSRDNVTNAMEAQLSVKLSDVYATLTNFLLTDFELPTQFQTALTATETALQEQARVQFEISSTITDTETQILASQKSSDIIGLQANATATSLLLDFNAEIIRVQANVAAAVTSYASLQSELGFTSRELISYVWLHTQNNLYLSPRYISMKSLSNLNI